MFVFIQCEILLCTYVLSSITFFANKVYLIAGSIILHYKIMSV